MSKFIVEKFVDGEFFHEELVESNQRLLNDNDLDTICLGKDVSLLFVRRATDTAWGYYIDDDGLWDYGTREDAENAIKRRIK